MKTGKLLPYKTRLYWYEQEKKEAIYTAKTQKELNDRLLKLAKKWRI